MTLREMRDVLARRQLRLTRSLGQNFLHDANQLRRIVETANLCAGEHVLEIGPGLGALTTHLLQGGATVWAVEKDARLVEILRERFRSTDRLTITHADALELLADKTAHDWRDWKVISNLPYSVASPILVELAHQTIPPALVVVTVQLEVAERLRAAAGDEAYGILSLLVQRQFEAELRFRLPASCFFPVPDVVSACVRLVRRTQPVVGEAQAQAYVRLVKLAFSQRRKMMFKLLRSAWPVELLERAWTKLGLPPEARAEVVSLERFGALAEILDRAPGRGAGAAGGSGFLASGETSG